MHVAEVVGRLSRKLWRVLPVLLRWIGVVTVRRGRGRGLHMCCAGGVAVRRVAVRRISVVLRWGLSEVAAHSIFVPISLDLALSKGGPRVVPLGFVRWCALGRMRSLLK